MGRSPFAVKYSPEQRSRIDGLLRRYQYSCLDLVLAELGSEGIQLSRSALGRHAQRLRSKDGLIFNSVESTVVLIVDLRTGASTQLRTSATPEVITQSIGALTSKSGFVSESSEVSNLCAAPFS